VVIALADAVFPPSSMRSTVLTSSVPAVTVLLTVVVIVIVQVAPGDSDAIVHVKFTESKAGLPQPLEVKEP
jgi:hypothetical protein